MTVADDLRVARQQLVEEMRRFWLADAADPEVELLVRALERFVDAKVGQRFGPRTKS